MRGAWIMAARSPFHFVSRGTFSAQSDFKIVSWLGVLKSKLVKLTELEYSVMYADACHRP